MSVETLALEVEAERVRAFELEPGPEATLKEVSIVEDGDSWFNYFPAHDVLTVLRRRRWGDRRYRVFDRAKAWFDVPLV